MAVVLGNLLRAGVMLAAAVVFSGACIYLFRHAHEPADYRVFRPESSEFSTIPGVIRSVLHRRIRHRTRSALRRVHSDRARDSAL